LGNVVDNYTLTVVDDAAWNPTISPAFLSIQPHENENATLTVTIPENAEISTIDNISVTATSQIDPSVKDEENCIARAVPLKYVWHIEIIDANDVGWWPSIDVSDDEVYISYYDLRNKDLKLAHWTGSAWVIETVDSVGDVGGWTSIALDPGGRPHISYYDFTNRNLKYARWTGSSWIIQVVDPSWETGKFTSLALDSNDRPHISYWDDRNRHLKYAFWTGSNWRIERVDALTDFGLFTSIDLDENDRAYIAYYGDYYLYCAKRTNSGWAKEAVQRADVHYGASIAIDNEGRPRIAYFDLRYADLKYAVGTKSGWIIETIDNVGSVGWHPSLALDRQSRPHISYYDLTNEALKYARWFGSEWVTQDVAKLNDVYYVGPTSLALDDNDLPHIAYLDSDGRYILMYAKDELIADLGSKSSSSLGSLSTVRLDLGLYLESWWRLVLRFYTYGNVYEGESVIWSGTVSVYLELTKHVEHPQGKSVERVVLVLIDGEGGETFLANFTVYREDLMDRITAILEEWPDASKEGRALLWSEISEILGQWPSAPS
jgi:hypothetical protein